MKKKIISGICIAVIVLVFCAGIAIGTQIDRKRSHATVPADTAPGIVNNDPFDGLVQSVEGTTPEMLVADYWLGENSDELLFSSEEIKSFNYENPLYVKYHSETENRNHYLFMYDLPEEISGEAVLDLIVTTATLEEASDTELIYINGSLPKEGYWTSLEQNLAKNRIPGNVEPKYYICLERVVAKTLPTNDFAAVNPEELFFNSFVSAEIDPLSGVAGLHESADGQWVFVISGSFCGWVEKDILAECKDREEWLSACQPEQFLIVTGSELVMDETAVPTASSGKILPMGTKIKLSDAEPDLVNGRSTYGSYVVEIPCCDQDGMMSWETTLIPVSKDVHVGYLTMTSESVVEQAFKLLGKVYGYGGSFASNDCSGIVCQIYACYGFELPRNARAIAKLVDLGSIDCAKMTASKKLEILEKMPAGMPLYMAGHLMIYLGMENGEPYVISSCATFIKPEHDPDDIQQGNCVFVSSLDLVRANGNTWLEDLSFILWKEY